VRLTTVPLIRWTWRSRAEQEPDVDEFELTMPARELRPIIERVYWSAVASLNNEPDELVDEAVAHLSDATVACPEILLDRLPPLTLPQVIVRVVHLPRA
jgi:hypothetical protein